MFSSSRMGSLFVGQAFARHTEPGDALGHEQALVDLARPELAQLHAERALERRLDERSKHVLERYRARAERHRAGAGDRVGGASGNVLHVDDADKRREQARRRDGIVSDPQRVRGVETDA
jgi:hypothetical protein